MVSLHIHFWMFVMSSVILAMLNFMVLGDDVPADPNDIHGGVTMGVSNAVCDDAKAHIEIDWDPRSSEEYTCSEDRHENYKVGLHYFHCEDIAQRPLHTCYPRVINYTDNLPTSGSHRPLWPKYGEYKYVPPQRWIHNLEHGAVVFLYHPCADRSEIEKFKAVAKGCLHRYIISPYKKMPQDMNFALLVWQCKLLLSSVDVPLMVNFVKTRALQAPEHTSKDGQYDTGLLHHAGIASDVDDSELCPGSATKCQQLCFEHGIADCIRNPIATEAVIQAKIATKTFPGVNILTILSYILKGLAITKVHDPSLLKMSIMSTTAEDFKKRSAARRSKSQHSQEEMMQILRQLMAGTKM